MEDNSTKLVGVGGWLLWFCLSAVLFQPLLSLLSLGIQEHIAWTDSDIFNVALGMFSFLTGVMLLVRSRPAVVMAGILCLFTAIGIPALWAIETLKGFWGYELAIDPGTVVRNIIIGAIWLLYFAISKRVHNTFGYNFRLWRRQNKTSAAAQG